VLLKKVIRISNITIVAYR